MVSLRHAVSLQDGREYVLKHALVRIFQPQDGGIFHSRLKEPTVLLDIAQVGREVFRRD